MKKIFILLKASMKNNMKIFTYRAKKDSSKFKKAMFPLILGALCFIAFYGYAEMFGEPLKEVGQTQVLLAIFAMIVVIMTLMETLNKAPGALFEVKDNDFLMSMPIKKNYVLISRFVKLMIFEYIFEIIIFIPALLKYTMLETVDTNFYIMSIIMFIVLPIIPISIACLIGGLIKMISALSKWRKPVQTICSLIFFFAIMYVSFDFRGVVSNMGQNASTIQDTINKIYYPIGMYLDLIKNFDIVKLIIFLAITIIPAAIAIFIIGKFYFKIISKSSEEGINRNYKFDVQKLKNQKNRTKLSSLVIKEIKRYFSSPVYIMNTIIGPLIMVGLTIVMVVNTDSIMNYIAQIQIQLQEIGALVDASILSKVYLELILFISLMTSITSCSISLEGPNIELLKSLPISTKEIFLSKILTSNIITSIPIFVSSIIFIITFKVFDINALFIILASFVFPTLSAILGLFINLKYPKLHFDSDAEVIKQSTSTMVAVLMGMLFAIVPAIVYLSMDDSMNFEFFAGGIIAVTICACVILWKLLLTSGDKMFKNINY